MKSAFGTIPFVSAWLKSMAERSTGYPNPLVYAVSRYFVWATNISCNAFLVSCSQDRPSAAHHLDILAGAVSGKVWNIEKKLFVV